MDEQKIEEIASKLNTKADVINYNSKRAILRKIAYPIIQLGIFIITVALDFLFLATAGSKIGLTYPSSYYSVGVFYAVNLNGLHSTINFVLCSSKKSQLNVKRNSTLVVGTLTNFLLSILVFLLIWREKVRYPIYPPNVYPAYGVFSEKNV